MATSDFTRIHLIKPGPPKPQKLDAKDIAATVLETVRECGRALTNVQEYTEWAAGQMSAELHQLELCALRAMARRRS